MKQTILISTLLTVLLFIGCKKEDTSPNSDYGVSSNGTNNGGGNNGTLTADFDLFKGYTAIPGSGMYLDTVTIIATNKSSGSPISYDWKYQVNDSRYWIGVPAISITNANWSRNIDLILNSNLYKDSTFVKVSLTVTDAAGNTSTKSQVLAYDMMSPFGYITYDNKTYDIGAIERVTKFRHRNEEQSGGECLIRIQDSANEDDISFGFLLRENALDPIVEVSVMEDLTDLYEGDATTIGGNVFGTTERSDVLQRITFSGTVKDNYTGIQKSISVDLNWLVAAKTLGSSLPDCKLD